MENRKEQSPFAQALWIAGALVCIFLAYRVWPDWHEGTAVLFPLGFLIGLAIQRGLYPSPTLGKQALVALFLMCFLVALQMIYHGFEETVAEAARHPGSHSSSEGRMLLLPRGLMLAFVGCVGCVAALLHRKNAEQTDETDQ